MGLKTMKNKKEHNPLMDIIPVWFFILIVFFINLFKQEISTMGMLKFIVGFFILSILYLFFCRMSFGRKSTTTD